MRHCLYSLAMCNIVVVFPLPATASTITFPSFNSSTIFRCSGDALTNVFFLLLSFSSWVVVFPPSAYDNILSSVAFSTFF